MPRFLGAWLMYSSGKDNGGGWRKVSKGSMNVAK